MKIIIAVAAAGCLAALSLGVQAQEKKKSKDSNSSSQTSPSFGGYPACEGGFFIVQEGQSTARCQRRDGKVCTIDAGTSGRGVLTNCT